MNEQTGGPWVALIDDDESYCRSTARLLRAAGMRAATFASAEAFVSEADVARFGCLILDIQLGGMSGLELHAEMSRRGWEIPVVYLTSAEDDESRRRAESAGCVDYLSKRVPAESLLAAIRRAVGLSVEP